MRVYLVGDFNDWDERTTPMRRNREDEWEATLDLEPDRQYEYRYLAKSATSERTWHNDSAADAHVRNPFGSDNSLVITAVESGRKKAGPAGPRAKRTRRTTAQPK